MPSQIALPATTWRPLRFWLIALLVLGVAGMHGGLPRVPAPTAHAAMTMADATAAGSRTARAPTGVPPPQHPGHPGGELCLSTLPPAPSTALPQLVLAVSGAVAAGRAVQDGVLPARAPGGVRASRPPPKLSALCVMRV